MTVAVDFDGVIHWYRHGWQGGKIYDPPMPGAIEAIKTITMVEAVAVFTARTDLDDVAQWLRDRGVPAITYDHWQSVLPPQARGQAFWNGMPGGEGSGTVLVTNRKPAARVYLDDRAVKFAEGGWNQALADMEITPAVFGRGLGDLDGILKAIHSAR